MKQNSPPAFVSVDVGVEGSEKPRLSHRLPTHCCKGGFCWVSTASSLLPLFFPLPPSCLLLKDSRRGVLQLCCLSLGCILPRWMPLCQPFPAQSFAHSFPKAVVIQRFHHGLQGHKASICVSLRHINFAPIMSDKSKDTGALCRSKMSHYFVTFRQSVAQAQELST